MECNKQKQFVDVTEPPFNARGDGKTDDTAAFQRAVDFLDERFGPLPREEQLRIPKDDKHTYPNYQINCPSGRSTRNRRTFSLKKFAFTSVAH